MDNNNINVSYSMSINSWQYAYVSLTSVLEHTKHFVNAYFLAYPEINDSIKQSFYQLEEKYGCVKIHFADISLDVFSDIESTGFRNQFIFYPFYLYKAFPDLNKVLQLSACTVVTSDLFELYSMDLGEKYIAAAPDFLNKKYAMTSFKEPFDFRNIVIDCAKFRKENMFEKLKDFVSFGFHSGIRTYENLFNTFFKDKFVKFDLKYNYVEFADKNFANKKVLNSKEYKQASKEAVIYNFRYSVPTNKNIYDAAHQLWLKYARLTPFDMDDLQYYKLSTTSAKNSFKYSWLLSRIFPYIKKYWFRIFLGFAIAIPLGLLDGVTTLALKPYMDYVIGGKAFEVDYHGLNFTITSLQMSIILPVGVILFAALQGVLRYLNGYFSTWTSQKITNDIKFSLFDKLVNMHPQFFDQNSSGVIISRYLTDPKTASAGIVDNLKTITTSLFGALGLIAVMFYSSWQLAFIGVFVLCVAFIPVILIRNRIKAASNENMVIGSNITTNFNETYSGNKVMAAYDLQQRQSKAFRQHTLASFDVNMALYKRSGWMSPMMYMIASIGIATVLGVGTYLINSGKMTAGSFASFVTSLLLLYKPIKTLGNTLTGIQNIFVAMGRVFELFDLETKIKNCDNPKILNGVNENIEFNNVYFEYVSGTDTVLKNLSLSVSKNETLAIVGNSGGGKSTLVNLLPRFYDVKSGSIKIDGVDVKNIELHSLRQNISMVFQDNFLFSGTIRENIMMGKPNATEEELMQAIKYAHLEETINELPEGLDTSLGERGLTLSGGQRQRVAIARAMIKNSPIVILDEATSALDNESEAIVQKAMDNLMQDRTVFIIAHRLSTIKNADRIAVINDGELVELGRHEELMNIENGHYKALYEMQFKKQEQTV